MPNDGDVLTYDAAKGRGQWAEGGGGGSWSGGLFDPFPIAVSQDAAASIGSGSAHWKIESVDLPNGFVVRVRGIFGITITGVEGEPIILDLEGLLLQIMQNTGITLPFLIELPAGILQLQGGGSDLALLLRRESNLTLEPVVPGTELNAGLGGVGLSGDYSLRFDMTLTVVEND